MRLLFANVLKRFEHNFDVLVTIKVINKTHCSTLSLLIVVQYNITMRAYCVMEDETGLVYKRGEMTFNASDLSRSEGSATIAPLW